MPTLIGGHSQWVTPNNMGHIFVTLSQQLDVTYSSLKCSLAKRKHTSVP